MSDREAVNHPDHYGGDTTYEVIKVLEAWFDGSTLGAIVFHLGNSIKYIARAGRKDPKKTLEDLKKARWYLDRAIGRLEEEQGPEDAQPRGSLAS